MRKITPEEADAAYTVLVKEVGAVDDALERQSFIWSVTDDTHPTSEYRFGGSIGFGGKFRNNGNRNDTPHVDCYREEESPEVNAAIERANLTLTEIFAAPTPAGPGRR